MIDDPGFLGRGWAFPPRFDAGLGAPAMSEADQDIVESLAILFQTERGERVMRPEYGCGLRRLVFEPLDAETEVAIEREISRAILFFEPRIDLIGVNARAVDPLEGRLEISVSFEVRQTNSRHNIVYPYYIREGSLLSESPFKTSA